MNKKEIKEKIRNHKLREALEILSQSVYPNEFAANIEIDLFLAMLSKLEQEERTGILSYEELSRSRNNLIYKILNFVEDIPEIGWNDLTVFKPTIQRFNSGKRILSRFSLPVVEELILLIKQNMRSWRLKNLLNILEKADGKLSLTEKNHSVIINPKILLAWTANSSLEEDPTLQEMWAGLLASLTKDEGKDSNLLFIDALKSITSSQARLINYICSNCSIHHKNHSFMPDSIEINLDNLKQIMETNDYVKIDYEIDNLRAREFLLYDITTGLGGGFIYDREDTVASLNPSPFLLQLHFKCNGITHDFIQFYSTQIIEKSNKQFRENLE